MEVGEQRAVFGICRDQCCVFPTVMFNDGSYRSGRRARSRLAGWWMLVDGDLSVGCAGVILSDLGESVENDSCRIEAASANMRGVLARQDQIQRHAKTTENYPRLIQHCAETCRDLPRLRACPFLNTRFYRSFVRRRSTGSGSRTRCWEAEKSLPY